MTQADFEKLYQDHVAQTQSAVSRVKDAKPQPTVVFDFDGVIHSYTSGWKGDTVIPDPPVPGIAEAIKEISKNYRVVVVSTRCSTQEGVLAIANYLGEHGIFGVSDITAEKPAAVCYIDDRAICFDGNSATLLDKIKNFKPWNR